MSGGHVPFWDVGNKLHGTLFSKTMCFFLCSMIGFLCTCKSQRKPWLLGLFDIIWANFAATSVLFGFVCLISSCFKKSRLQMCSLKPDLIEKLFSKREKRIVSFMLWEVSIAQLQNHLCSELLVLPSQLEKWWYRQRHGVMSDCQASFPLWTGRVLQSFTLPVQFCLLF